jgi:hypothetical protein
MCKSMNYWLTSHLSGDNWQGENNIKVAPDTQYYHPDHTDPESDTDIINDAIT